MINQDVCTFYNALGIYDDFGGVAVNESEGKEIAKAVGSGKGAILRNHGLITVGQTVDEAGYLFMLLEKSCQIQMEVDQYAAITGSKKLIASEESAKFTHEVQADPQTLYTEFQPEYHLESSFSDDFLR
jgi:ribulose-5-phosphate 4-epimerase/fuculose-1-phosphate aldolase